MTELEALGIALDRIYGLDKKPDCPVCGLPLPQPHNHCTCEAATNTRCKDCGAYVCPRCEREHGLSYLEYGI